MGAKAYFRELYEISKYQVCKKMLEKIETIEISEISSTQAQQIFIKEQKDYLDIIEGYSSFEFELLNSGRNIEEVKKEIQFIKKFEGGAERK